MSLEGGGRGEGCNLEGLSQGDEDNKQPAELQRLSSLQRHHHARPTGMCVCSVRVRVCVYVRACACSVGSIVVCGASCFENSQRLEPQKELRGGV